MLRARTPFDAGTARFGPRRSLVRVLLLAAVLAGIATAAHTLLMVHHVHAASTQRTAATPYVGHGIFAYTQTCSRARTSHTPTSPADCIKWSRSGPVNVVIYVRHGSAAATISRVWKKADGHWLVAEAAGDGTNGCPSGWVGSKQQFQLRLTARSRRHIKLVTLACRSPAGTVVVGDAHTDMWTQSCGGDYMVDVDKARDSLVASLRGVPGVTVTYRPGPPAIFPSRCGGAVRSDGRVAYITIG
jgi:hypothetical protein